jgi:hypothetical protein
MEEKNSPGDEDARITVPWLPLSVMLSGFFSPLPERLPSNNSQALGTVLQHY